MIPMTTNSSTSVNPRLMRRIDMLAPLKIPRLYAYHIYEKRPVNDFLSGL